MPPITTFTNLEDANREILNLRQQNADYLNALLAVLNYLYGRSLNDPLAAHLYQRIKTVLNA